jgi:hypothetical protein
MARDQSFDEKRRQREREDERDEELTRSLKGKSRSGQDLPLNGSGSTEKLIELFERAEPMIEQLNNLYQQYVVGVESRPPIERRKQLDQVMMTLQIMGKPMTSHQFRFNTLNARYLTHRDRWDRLMKELESGKIKRVTGPKRG